MEAVEDISRHMKDKVSSMSQAGKSCLMNLPSPIKHLLQCMRGDLGRLNKMQAPNANVLLF